MDDIELTEEDIDRIRSIYFPHQSIEKNEIHRPVTAMLTKTQKRNLNRFRELDIIAFHLGSTLKQIPSKSQFTSKPKDFVKKPVKSKQKIEELQRILHHIAKEPQEHTLHSNNQPVPVELALLRTPFAASFDNPIRRIYLEFIEKANQEIALSYFLCADFEYPFGMAMHTLGVVLVKNSWRDCIIHMIDSPIRCTVKLLADDRIITTELQFLRFQETSDSFQSRLSKAIIAKKEYVDQQFLKFLPTLVLKYNSFDDTFPKTLTESLKKLVKTTKSPAHQKIVEECLIEIEDEYRKAMIISTFVVPPSFEYRSVQKTITKGSISTQKESLERSSFSARINAALASLRFGALSIFESLNLEAPALVELDWLKQTSFAHFELVSKTIDIQWRDLYKAFALQVSNEKFAKIMFQAHAGPLFIESCLLFVKILRDCQVSILLELRFLDNDIYFGMNYQDLKANIKQLTLTYLEREWAIVFDDKVVFRISEEVMDFNRRRTEDSIDYLMEKLQELQGEQRDKFRGIITINLENLSTFTEYRDAFMILDRSLEAFQKLKRKGAYERVGVVTVSYKALWRDLEVAFSQFHTNLCERTRKMFQLLVEMKWNEYVESVKSIEMKPTSVVEVCEQRNCITRILENYSDIELVNYRKLFSLLEQRLISIDDFTMINYFKLLQSGTFLYSLALQNNDVSVKYLRQYLDSIHVELKNRTIPLKNTLEDARRIANYSISIDNSLGSVESWDILANCIQNSIIPIVSNIKVAQAEGSKLISSFKLLEVPRAAFQEFETVLEEISVILEYLELVIKAVTDIYARFENAVFDIPVLLFEKDLDYLIDKLGEPSPYQSSVLNQELRLELFIIKDEYLQLLKHISSPQLRSYSYKIEGFLRIKPKSLQHLRFRDLINLLETQDRLILLHKIDKLEKLSSKEHNFQHEIHQIELKYKSLTIESSECKFKFTGEIRLISNAESLSSSLGIEANSLELIVAKRVSDHLIHQCRGLLDVITHTIEVLQLLTNAQANLVQVFKLIENPEIEAHIDDELERVRNISQDFNQIVTFAIETQNLKIFAGKDSRLKLLLSGIQRDCEVVYTKMRSWIEDSRKHCPRLYMLSDQELLQNTSIEFQPQEINRIVSKCYSFISGLHFDKDRILGYLDKSGGIEYFFEPKEFPKAEIRLSNIINIIDSYFTQNIQHWIFKIWKYYPSKQGKLLRSEFVEKLLILQDAPLQAVFVGMQLAFTREVEETLTNTGLDGIYSFYTSYSAYLNNLSTRFHVCGKYAKMLIGTACYFKSVLKDLVDSKIRDLSDISWLRNVRYYTNAECTEITIKHGLVTMKYSFEPSGSYIPETFFRKYDNFMDLSNSIYYHEIIASSSQSEYFRDYCYLVGKFYRPVNGMFCGNLTRMIQFTIRMNSFLIVHRFEKLEVNLSETLLEFVQKWNQVFNKESALEWNHDTIQASTEIGVFIQGKEEKLRLIDNCKIMQFSEEDFDSGYIDYWLYMNGFDNVHETRELVAVLIPQLETQMIHSSLPPAQTLFRLIMDFSLPELSHLNRGLSVLKYVMTEKIRPLLIHPNDRPSFDVISQSLFSHVTFRKDYDLKRVYFEDSIDEKVALCVELLGKYTGLIFNGPSMSGKSWLTLKIQESLHGTLLGFDNCLLDDKASLTDILALYIKEANGNPLFLVLDEDTSEKEFLEDVLHLVHEGWMGIESGELIEIPRSVHVLVRNTDAKSLSQTNSSLCGFCLLSTTGIYEIKLKNLRQSFVKQYGTCFDDLEKWIDWFFEYLGINDLQSKVIYIDHLSNLIQANSMESVIVKEKMALFDTFLFSSIWIFSSQMHREEQRKFESALKERLLVQLGDHPLLTRSIYDLCFSSVSLSWNEWIIEMREEALRDVQSSLENLYPSAVNTKKGDFLFSTDLLPIYNILKMLIKERRHFLLFGGSGSRKSELLKFTFAELNEYDVFDYPFLLKSNFEDLKKFVIQNLVYDGKKGLLRHPKGISSCFVLHDVDEKLLTSEFIQKFKALLRYRGLFLPNQPNFVRIDPSNFHFVIISDDNLTNAELMENFLAFNVLMPSKESLKEYYEMKFRERQSTETTAKHKEKSKAEFMELEKSRSMTLFNRFNDRSGSQDLLHNDSDEQPLASVSPLLFEITFHLVQKMQRYGFNMTNFHSVFQGFSFVTQTTLTNPLETLKFWLNTVYRVFYDRLSTEDERLYFRNCLRDLCEGYCSNESLELVRSYRDEEVFYSTLVNRRSLLYSSATLLTEERRIKTFSNMKFIAEFKDINKFLEEIKKLYPIVRHELKSPLDEEFLNLPYLDVSLFRMITSLASSQVKVYIVISFDSSLMSHLVRFLCTSVLEKTCFQFEIKQNTKPEEFDDFIRGIILFLMQKDEEVNVIVNGNISKAFWPSLSAILVYKQLDFYYSLEDYRRLYLYYCNDGVAEDDIYQHLQSRIPDKLRFVFLCETLDVLPLKIKNKASMMNMNVWSAETLSNLFDGMNLKNPKSMYTPQLRRALVAIHSKCSKHSMPLHSMFEFIKTFDSLSFQMKKTLNTSVDNIIQLSRTVEFGIKKFMDNLSNAVTGTAEVEVRIATLKEKVKLNEEEKKEKEKAILQHREYMMNLKESLIETEKEIQKISEWQKNRDLLRLKLEEEGNELRKLTKSDLENMRFVLGMPMPVQTLLKCIQILFNMEGDHMDKVIRMFGSQSIIIKLIHINLDLLRDEQVEKLAFYYNHESIKESADDTLDFGAKAFIRWLNQVLTYVYETKMSKQNGSRKKALIRNVQEKQEALSKARKVERVLQGEQEEVLKNDAQLKSALKVSQVTLIMKDHMKKVLESKVTLRENVSELIAEGLREDSTFGEKLKEAEASYKSVTFEYSQIEHEIHELGNRIVNLNLKLKQFLGKLKEADLDFLISNKYSFIFRESTIMTACKTVMTSLLDLEKNRNVSLDEVKIKVDMILKSEDFIPTKQFTQSFKIEGFAQKSMVSGIEGIDLRKLPKSVSHDVFKMIYEIVQSAYNLQICQKDIKRLMETPSSRKAKARNDYENAWKDLLNGDLVFDNFGGVNERLLLIRKKLEWCLGKSVGVKLHNWELPTFLCSLFSKMQLDDTGNVINLEAWTKKLLDLNLRTIPYGTIEDVHSAMVDPFEFFPCVNESLSRVSVDFISALPLNLMLRVTSFIPEEDLINLPLVCRKWKELTTDKEVFWQLQCYKSGWGHLLKNQSVKGFSWKRLKLSVSKSIRQRLESVKKSLLKPNIGILINRMGAKPFVNAYLKRTDELKALEANTHNSGKLSQLINLEIFNEVCVLVDKIVESIAEHEVEFPDEADDEFEDDPDFDQQYQAFISGVDKTFSLINVNSLDSKSKGGYKKRRINLLFSSNDGIAKKCVHRAVFENASNLGYANLLSNSLGKFYKHIFLKKERALKDIKVELTHPLNTPSANKVSFADVNRKFEWPATKKQYAYSVCIHLYLIINFMREVVAFKSGIETLQNSHFQFQTIQNLEKHLNNLRAKKRRAEIASETSIGNAALIGAYMMFNTTHLNSRNLNLLGDIKLELERASIPFPETLELSKFVKRFYREYHGLVKNSDLVPTILEKCLLAILNLRYNRIPIVYDSQGTLAKEIKSTLQMASESLGVRVMEMKPHNMDQLTNLAIESHLNGKNSFILVIAGNTLNHRFPYPFRVVNCEAKTDLLKEIIWKFYLKSMITDYYKNYLNLKVGDSEQKIHLQSVRNNFESRIINSKDEEWLEDYEVLADIVYHSKGLEERRKSKRLIMVSNNELSIAYERFKPAISFITVVWNCIAEFMIHEDRGILQPPLHSKHSVYEWPLVEYIRYLELIMEPSNSKDPSSPQIALDFATFKQTLVSHCYKRSVLQFPRLKGILFRVFLGLAVRKYEGEIEDTEYQFLIELLTIDCLSISTGFKGTDLLADRFKELDKKYNVTVRYFDLAHRLSNPAARDSKSKLKEWQNLVFDLLTNPGETVDVLRSYEEEFYFKYTGREKDDNSEVISEAIESLSPLSNKNMFMIYSPHIKEPLIEYWLPFLHDQISLKNDLVRIKVIHSRDPSVFVSGLRAVIGEARWVLTEANSAEELQALNTFLKVYYQELSENELKGKKEESTLFTIIVIMERSIHELYEDVMLLLPYTNILRLPIVAPLRYKTDYLVRNALMNYPQKSSFPGVVMITCLFELMMRHSEEIQKMITENDDKYLENTLTSLKRLQVWIQMVLMQCGHFLNEEYEYNLFNYLNRNYGTLILGKVTIEPAIDESVFQKWRMFFQRYMSEIMVGGSSMKYAEQQLWLGNSLDRQTRIVKAWFDQLFDRTPIVSWNNFPLTDSQNAERFAKLQLVTYENHILCEQMLLNDFDGVNSTTLTRYNILKQRILDLEKSLDAEFFQSVTDLDLAALKSNFSLKHNGEASWILYLKRTVILALKEIEDLKKRIKEYKFKDGMIRGSAVKDLFILYSEALEIDDKIQWTKLYLKELLNPRRAIDDDDGPTTFPALTDLSKLISINDFLYTCKVGIANAYSKKYYETKVCLALGNNRVQEYFNFRNINTWTRRGYVLKNMPQNRLEITDQILEKPWETMMNTETRKVKVKPLAEYHRLDVYEGQAGYEMEKQPLIHYKEKERS